MFQKIDSSRPIVNNGINIAVGGRGSGFSDTYGYLNPNTEINDYIGKAEYYRGSFDLGSGMVIDSNGTTVYDTVRDGSGLLYDLLLVNRGNGTLYFGINDATVGGVNTGTPLGSGESYSLDTSSVRSLWARTLAGTALLQGQALYGYQRNTN